MVSMTPDEEIADVIQQHLIPAVSKAQDEILQRWDVLVYFTVDWETVEIEKVPKAELKKRRLSDWVRFKSP
jgi:hypothetical protein